MEIEKTKPVRKDLLMFGTPLIEEDDIIEVIECLRSRWITTGPRVASFERIFRDYIGTRYSVALSSCSAALHLSMLAAGISQGDEVITTPMTFAATTNAILHVGAKPVYVDVEKDTMNIDPNLIKKAITPNTKAILPVHFAGRPCKMDHIMEIAKQKDLLVIEDAAHAIEAKYKGKKIGDIGDMGCFSFYVTKNIVTAEGGILTTNNDEYANKVRMYSSHGINKNAWQRKRDNDFKPYEILSLGFKYNMTDIQASLGISQMKKLDRYFERRKQVWKKYDEAFEGLPITTPLPEEKNTVHARHMYTILLNLEHLKINRYELIKALLRENIGTSIHYISLHLHKYYRDMFCFKGSDFPNSLYISERTISIPFSANLTDEDVEDVIEAVIKVTNYYKK